MRIGHGIDAHRLVANRPLMLGGVRIQYEMGLLGHSDGDAVAHALGDALLGAAGLGDLGQHFSPNDPKWHDVAGVTLLRVIASKIRDAGYMVESAHVVAIAEEPRLAPHTQAMTIAIAQALDVNPDRIVVTATTTDGMGFAGRGEGIAASAVALLLSLPG